MTRPSPLPWLCPLQHNSLLLTWVSPRPNLPVSLTVIPQCENLQYSYISTAIETAPSKQLLLASSRPLALTHGARPQLPYLIHTIPRAPLRLDCTFSGDLPWPSAASGLICSPQTLRPFKTSVMCGTRTHCEAWL